MDSRVRQTLCDVAEEFGTPAYVYFLDTVLERIRELRTVFQGRFEISYAVKSNPNLSLLRAVSPVVDTLDASSAGEIDRGLDAGYEARRLTFSGPAKRDLELQRAVHVECGLVVCESPGEMTALDELGRRAGRRVPIALRVNPRRAPRKFGVNMAGKPSQFGVDEEALEALALDVAGWPNLELKGFHIYSGTNSLSDEAIAENFSIFVELFDRGARLFNVSPEVLIFGSGFGIPYHVDQAPLDIGRLAGRVIPMVDALKSRAPFERAACVLEMGRYLVGPAGYFLTRVVSQKRSRGTDICLCDGGFNNHLAAFGLMGTVIRRNWSMWNISRDAGDLRKRYMLVGPLCTTIDTLAQDIELPIVATGDVIAVGASGAYGLTASPLHFISHPPPREIMVHGAAEHARWHDVSEMSRGGVLAER